MVTNPAVHELNNIEVQGGDSDYAVVNIAGSTDDVLLEYDDSAGEWSFAGVVSGSDLADGSVTVEELADALGTDSNNPVSGTTYFENTEHDSVNTEELGITNAGAIFEQQAHIPCGWATATETPDEVTSTDFVQAGSFIGGFDDTQRPDGATLYMRYDLRINLDDGETATVRLRGNGDSGASRITEEYQFDGTGSFSDTSSGWIEVTTDAVGDPMNVDTIEAKVSGGTLQFSSGMVLGCQFAWRVE